MNLKFSFGGGSASAASSPDHSDHAQAAGGIPLPFAGSSSHSSGPMSSVLELRVSLSAAPEGAELICEGLSPDGVSYARASRRVGGEDAAAFAAALRSVLARGGAELPEPLIGSVSGVLLSLGGREAEVLRELGLEVAEGSTQLAAVDEALQARTGIAAGTHILVA